MHLKTKKLAFSGIALALCIIFMVLGSVIESNTLALLALASFSVGIITCEFGVRYGVAYLAAAIILGFLIAPNKFYCLTFATMGLYILLDEVLWLILNRVKMKQQRINLQTSDSHQKAVKWGVLMWIAKWLIFNAMYVPIILIFPAFLFTGKLAQYHTAKGIMLVLLLGQIVWLIYDRVYDYFQHVIWNKYRKILK